MKIHCLYDELFSPQKLKPHPKNHNKHSNDQIARLAQILEYQGWRYAIKISKRSDFITSGHGRLLAAILKGWKKVPIVYQDYESDEQEYADVQADNAIASWAELDLAAINLDVPDLGPDFDIDLLGIKDFEIEAADKYQEGEDDVPEPRRTDIKMGDLWQLGVHRLLCADATDPLAVGKLMNGEKADMVYTDPPYGMFLNADYSSMTDSKTGTKGSKFRNVEGDHGDYNPQPAMKIFDYCKEQFWFGADYYAERLPNKNEGSWVVWDKRSDLETTAETTVNTDRVFGSCFELCWSRSRHKRSIARIMWSGKFVGNTAREHDGIQKHVHPTQKPIALSIWFFERWGKDKTNIVDLYGGSGSTLIACEKQNKKCFMIEIDPEYCQMIIDRWEKFTGKKALKTVN